MKRSGWRCTSNKAVQGSKFKVGLRCAVIPPSMQSKLAKLGKIRNARVLQSAFCLFPFALIRSHSASLSCAALIRRWRTASASPSTKMRESSQPMQASVMLRRRPAACREQVLAAGVEVALHHHAEDARRRRRRSAPRLPCDVDLFRWILAAVAVAAVDHDARRKAGFGQTLGAAIDVRGVVVRLLAAAQDEVAVLVAGG